MKTNSSTSTSALSLLRVSAIVCLLALLAGCSSVSSKFAEFEKLGLTEAEITGKFSHTDYKVAEKDGTRRAELNHSNAWIPKARFVRETPAK